VKPGGACIRMAGLADPIRGALVAGARCRPLPAPDRMVNPQDSSLRRVATNNHSVGCRETRSTPGAMDLQPVDDSHQHQLFVAHRLVKGIENRAQEVRAQLVEDGQHLFLHLG